MAQIVVRNLDDDVKTRLKRLAARHGRSMEDEVRQILRNAAYSGSKAKLPLGTRMAAHFAGSGLSLEVPELRGQPARPAEF